MILDEKHGVFRPRATHGIDDKFVREIKDRHIQIGETLVGRAAERSTIDADFGCTGRSSSVLDVIVRAGFRSPAYRSADRQCQPHRGARRPAEAAGEFPKDTVDLLQTFAAQSVLAIKTRACSNARRRARAIGQITGRFACDTGSPGSNRKARSLGQLTAGIAHEIKNPLNFVNNFASLSAELTDELDDVLTPAMLIEKTR